MIAYLDASAWVKRYRSEDGTEAVHLVFEQATTLTSSVVGMVEVTSALSRRGVFADASQHLTDDLSDIDLVETTEWLALSASELAATFKLRGADAIHLATAMFVEVVHDAPVTFVTADGDLIQACNSLEVPVLDPRD